MTRADDRQATLNLALFLAVTKGDKAEARRLLRDGANPNVEVEGKRSAFAEAVNLKRFALAQLLIEQGALVNYQEHAGVSMPPWISGVVRDALTQSTERTQFYINHGADFGISFAYGTDRLPHTFSDVSKLLPLAMNAQQRKAFAAACDLIAARQAKVAKQRQEKIGQRRTTGGGKFKL